jgi:FKBP-type peptidyl-prolyl cis-trans isomerase FklB
VIRTYVIVIALAASLFARAFAQEQQSPSTNSPPLSVSDIDHSLKAGVTNTRMAVLVKQYGVDFGLTDAVEKELRAAGANSDLLLQIARNKRLNGTLESSHPVESESKSTHTTPINNSADVLKSSKEKYSYAAGTSLGKVWGQGLPSVELDPTLLAQGWQHTLSNSNTRLTPEEAVDVLTEARHHTAAALSKSLTENLSYALGMFICDFGRGLETMIPPIEFDPGLIAEGVKDTLSNRNMRLTPEENKAVFTEFQAEYDKKQQQAMKEASEKNKIEGARFLAANKLNEGVVTLPSGLQYKILREGDGRKPISSDRVVVAYEGKLINGREFASIHKAGKPSEFQVSHATKGWTEALQLMPVGSKWELYIPPDLAFGEKGAGMEIQIGPNSTLIEEMELLSIKPKE